MRKKTMTMQKCRDEQHGMAWLQKKDCEVQKKPRKKKHAKEKGEQRVEKSVGHQMR